MFLRRKKIVDPVSPENDALSPEEVQPESADFFGGGAEAAADPEEEGTEGGGAVAEEAAEETAEPETVSASHANRYWEFPLFIGIAAVLAIILATLLFFLIKGMVRGDENRISIRNIPEEVVQNGLSDSGPATKPEDPAEAVPAAGTKAVDPKEIAIKVLNGGAASGSAGKAKAFLGAAGYQKVEAGNSEKSDYAGVTVFYQNDSKSAAEKILSDMKSQYPSAQTKAGSSSEEKSSAIVIILGR